MAINARLHLIFFILFLFSACGGSGTEVVNPGNNQKTKAQFEGGNYEITMTLEAGWTFVEYGADDTPLPGAFTDGTDPKTITVAEFFKGESRFTIFTSFLLSNETLLDFAQHRNPSVDFDIHTSTRDGVTVESTSVFYLDAGPHGGDMLDLYIAVNDEVLWMRAELVGTDEEIEKTKEEFVDIVGSIEFVKKN